MIRVLHLIAEMGIGGAESIVAELVHQGPAVDWTSAVASAGGVGASSLRQDGTAEQFFVPPMRRRPAALLSSVRYFRRAVSTFKPDVIVAHNIGATLVAAVSSRASKRRYPLISVFHGVSAPDYHRAGQVLDHGPDYVVAVSQSIRDRLTRAGMHRTDATVIPNAVSIPTLPSHSEARRSLELDADVPVALCLARMVEQKRHDVLLRAWAQLPNEAVLLMAGDGACLAQSQRLASELGLTAQVRFLGVSEDVATLLAAADLSTLASDWEGLPIAVLESMAAGLPIVGTAVDGLAEAVHAGEGILVPRNDPTALSMALSTYLFDPVARQMAGAAARLGVSARHRPREMAAAYAELVRLGLDRRSVAMGFRSGDWGR